MAEGRTRVKPSAYRDGQNVIRDSASQRIVYMPPEAKDVPALMKALVAWLASSERQDLPCPLRAGIAHYQFATIHPYYDGNGRTARLLLNYHLLRHGYPLTIIEVEQRSEYLAVLEEANAGRLVPFATFILQCVERSILRILGPA